MATRPTMGRPGQQPGVLAAGAQPPQLPADGEVGMSTAWNGRIGSAVRTGQPLRITLHGQVLDHG